MAGVTNVRPTTMLRSASAGLTLALLAGCGESDLPEHHRELLAEAAANEGATTVVEPDAGAEAGSDAGPDAEPAPGAGADAEPGIGAANGADGTEGADGANAGPDASESPDDAGEMPAPAGGGMDGDDGPSEEADGSETVPIGGAEGDDGAADGSGEPSTDGADSENADGGDATDGTSAPTGDAGDRDTGADGDANEGTDGDADAGTDAGMDADAESQPTAPEPPAAAAPGDASGGDPSTEGAPVEGIDLDDGYELAFFDEFDGPALDPSKWKTAFEYGNAPVDQELQYYVDTLGEDGGFGHDPFSFADGALTIRAIETPDDMRAEALGRDWLSGVLSTAGMFDFEQGYAEIRVDLPEGAGLGSMFTLIASDYTEASSRPTVFVMRHDGADADELEHEYRFTDAEGQRRTPGTWTVADDSLPAGFHTIGVSWDDEGLLYFVDGEATYRIVGDELPAQPLYLVTNLAIGGANRDAPDAATPRPAELVIDYVRVWQKSP